MIKHSVFSVMAKLIVEMLYLLFSVPNTMKWAEMSEYEAYWLTDFPLIIYWVLAKKYIFMVISQEKQINKYMEN